MKYWLFPLVLIILGSVATTVNAKPLLQPLTTPKLYIPLVANAQSPTATIIPTALETPDTQATIEQSIIATLTALAPTPTSTPTFNAQATIEQSVNATLTALAPTSTATRTATNTPTETSTATPTATSIPVLFDDFDDNQINNSMWQAIIYGTESTITEINQQLELTHTANAKESTGHNFFAAQYSSQCRLSGDFDIQVSYRLLTWPNANGVRVGLSVDDNTDMTENFPVLRFNSGLGNSESYATNFYVVNTLVSTQDTEGKLRLERRGNSLSGYYMKMGNWVLLHTDTMPTYDVYFSVQSWSHSYTYGKQETKIAFDNFMINAGSLICP